MTHLIVLDSEAVQALVSVHHRKHQKVIAQFEVVESRKRRAMQVVAVVPTTVRVEAGWDRTAPNWALANRLRIGDIHLDGTEANTAAAVRARVGTHISVVDAHVGAVLRRSASTRVTVLTSDPDGVRAVAESTPITIVQI